MSTNSTIAIQHKDGTIEQVYCHWDGYLSHNGKILLGFYTERSKVEELIKLGSISILDKDIGEQQDFDKRTAGMTLAYHRDRDETLHIDKFSSKRHMELDGNLQEFNYFFNDNDTWEVGKKIWSDLAEAIYS